MAGAGSEAAREPVPAGAYDRAATGPDDPFASAFLPASAADYDPPAEADGRPAYGRPAYDLTGAGSYDQTTAPSYDRAASGSGPADDHEARAGWGAGAADG